MTCIGALRSVLGGAVPMTLGGSVAMTLGGSVPMTLAAIGATGQRAYRRLEFDRAALAFWRLEGQRERHFFTRLHLAMQVDEHDVITAGAQLDRLAGRQPHGWHLAHRHYVVLHCHLVHFNTLGHGGVCGDELGVCIGGELHEGTRAVLLRPRGPDPGILDLDLCVSTRGKREREGSG